MFDNDHGTAESQVSRRRLLAGAAGLAGAGLVASASPASAGGLEGDGLFTPQSDVSPLAMVSRNYLGNTNTALYYEPSGNRTSFTFDQTFYNRLGYWRNEIDQWSATHWGYPYQVYSYGAYVNKPGMHGLGRAFDIAKVLFRTTSGGTIHVSCRYDVWRSGSNFALHAKRYWGLAASLCRRFSWVITYPYNSQHHNHIHVDNDLYSLLGDCHYRTGSSTQTYIVQGACRYVWGYSTGIDGIWGSQTQSHSNAVLRRIGRSSGSITSKANFQAFLKTTFQQASNAVDY